MLKQLAKSIRRQLLKINWFKREVEAYQQEQGERRKERLDSERFARFANASNAIHSDDDDSPDNTVLVDYADSRMTGQRSVTPMYVKVGPFGMGRK